MLNITKRFPGIVANDNITLQLKKGEIHALLGKKWGWKINIFPCLYSQFPLRNQEHRRQREYHMIKDKDNKGDKIHDGNCSNRRCIYRY